MQHLDFNAVTSYHKQLGVDHKIKNDKKISNKNNGSSSIICSSSNNITLVGASLNIPAD